MRTPSQFLRSVSEGFGLIPVRVAGDNQKLIERFLLDEYKAGRHPILLIDEAQNVHPDNIDVMSNLSNFQTAEDKLITIVLLAQDNFPNKLSRKDAFRSRIAVVSNLDPLTPDDMTAMIDHRVKTAGGTGAESLFDARALIEIYNISKGIPRDVCVLCDAALVNAFVRAEKAITPGIVSATYAEMVRAKKWPARLPEATK
jgi:general secretion pathway protein A